MYASHDDNKSTDDFTDENSLESESSTMLTSFHTTSNRQQLSLITTAHDIDSNTLHARGITKRGTEKSSQAIASNYCSTFLPATYPQPRVRSNSTSRIRSEKSGENYEYPPRVVSPPKFHEASHHRDRSHTELSVPLTELDVNVYNPMSKFISSPVARPPQLTPRKRIIQDISRQ